ncbi:hypothetical protein B0J12DRAFT_463168 [Macrophomina phaseolina]|uniref:Uncharacterized protein n=1 Tax=Macrophomina phaseolina TaxID=35725 RepID=A0ABQ8FQ92_9PEZI|nr:hypothetical protein B0J12DRAFT_463168 [Macrophomina phaseolina]
MTRSDISLALETLCDAPEEELQHHLVKAQQAFQKLQSLLSGCGLPAHSHREPFAPVPNNGTLQPLSNRSSSPAQSRASPHPSDSCNTGPSLESNAIQRPFDQGLLAAGNVHTPTSRTVITRHDFPHPQDLKVGLPPHAVLLHKLQEKYPQIEAFLEQASKAITKEPTWEEEDPRVLDIQTCDRRTVTKEHQFLRALGQRSLARDFERWELAKYEYSRVTELLDTLDSPESASGHISEFVNETADINDKSVAKRGIAHGIKLFVVEILTGHCGISALLAFVFADFRDLKYSSYHDLVTLLANCHDTRIYDLAKRMSKWSKLWQEIYDEKRSYEKCRRKRRRLDDEEQSELHEHSRRWNGMLAVGGTDAFSNAEASNRHTETSAQPIRRPSYPQCPTTTRSPVPVSQLVEQQIDNGRSHHGDRQNRRHVDINARDVRSMEDDDNRMASGIPPRAMSHAGASTHASNAGRHGEVVQGPHQISVLSPFNLQPLAKVRAGLTCRIQHLLGSPPTCFQRNSIRSKLNLNLGKLH